MTNLIPEFIHLHLDLRNGFDIVANMKFDLPERLTFVDIETTGSHVLHDRIIEIGVLRVENNKLVSTYQTLFNPQTIISPFISELTGIQSQDLENAPLFEDVEKEIFDLLQDSVFVAHNVRFDYSFLRNEFARLGRKFKLDHFCTARLSRSLYPQFPRHNLDVLMERFSLACDHRHRAFDDAKVLWDFYQIIQKQFPYDHLAKAITVGLRKPTIPLLLTEEALKELPDTPGVYIFYAENNAPLYVGKSKNIHDRVMSHFSADYLSNKEMKLSQQVARIEFIETAGELGALLRESQLVKQLQPIYNRLLRQSRKLVLLRRMQNEDGYMTLYLEDAVEIKPGDIENIMGVFRSKKQAKDFLIDLAKEKYLCEKLLGLEKSKGACFGYQLKACSGACAGKEIPASYNVRLMQALYRTKLKSWPFNSAVEITENNEYTGKKEVFIIDQWCLLTTLSGSQVSEETIILKSQSSLLTTRFDMDIYKILRRYLRSEKNIRKVAAGQNPTPALY